MPYVFTAALALAFLNDVGAEETASSPVTISDLNISAEALAIVANPLTKDELIIEAQAWRDAVKAKAEEIARSLLANADGSQAETLTSLRAERTLLIDKLRVIIDTLEAKSATEDSDAQAIIKDHRLYMADVAGIRVNVSDAESAWRAISGWLHSEQGGLRWLRNLAIFIAIIIVARLIAAIARFMLRRGFDKVEWPELLEDFLVKAIYWIVMLGGVLMALAALEVNMGPLLAMVGAAGFIIAFAMQDSLSNFASGLMILFFRPFDMGDVVDAGGVSGVVESMNLVATTIKTFDNKKMIVPNNKIIGDVITNATGVNERRVDLEFGIGYDDDIDQAHGVLEEIVSAHPKVLKEPATTIRLHTLADSSVNFVVRPWTKTSDYWTVYWDITREVKNRFDAEGIGIPYPQQDVHLHLADDSIKKTLTSAGSDSDRNRPFSSMELDAGDEGGD